MSNEMYNVLSRATDGLYEGKSASADPCRLFAMQMYAIQFCLVHSSLCTALAKIWSAEVTGSDCALSSWAFNSISPLTEAVGLDSGHHAQSALTLYWHASRHCHRR